MSNYSTRRTILNLVTGERFTTYTNEPPHTPADLIAAALKHVSPETAAAAHETAATQYAVTACETYPTVTHWMGAERGDTCVVIIAAANCHMVARADTTQPYRKTAPEISYHHTHNEECDNRTRAQRIRALGALSIAKQRAALSDEEKATLNEILAAYVANIAEK